MKLKNHLTAAAAVAFAVLGPAALAQVADPVNGGLMDEASRPAAGSGSAAPAGQGPGTMSSDANGPAGYPRGPWTRGGLYGPYPTDRLQPAGEAPEPVAVPPKP